MSDLIPFTPRTLGAETVNTVNARDLHAFLDIKRDYSDWIRRAIKRAGLIEGADFVISYTPVENPRRGRPASEHHLTFDAAKHVALMSSVQKGQEVRAYFIAKEQELRAIQERPTFERYPELRAIVELVQSTAEARALAEAAQQEASTAKALAQQALDSQQWLTIREYVFLNALDRQMPGSSQQDYGRWLSGYCAEHRIPIRTVSVSGQKWAHEHGYHVGTIEKTLPGWLARLHGQGALIPFPAQQQHA